MEYLTIALPKGKLFDRSVKVLAKVGCDADNVVEDSRKLVITNEKTKVRFIIVKTMDLPVYVEYGAADIGIIGKDVLKEEERDVYELLDMGYGKCHLMMAVPEEKVLPRMMDYTHMRVATKYPHSAVEFFDRQGMQMEIIKLNGSIELAPIVGLSELIVDIVETGNTLVANGLKVYEDISLHLQNQYFYYTELKKLNPHHRHIQLLWYNFDNSDIYYFLY